MCYNREKNSCCRAVSIIASLIGAFGIAGIYFGGFLTNILPIVLITLILGILGILYVLITAPCGDYYNSDTFCLIPISVGAIISSAFALAITFVSATLSLIPILIAVAFFMILLLITLVYIIIRLLTIN